MILELRPGQDRPNPKPFGQQTTHPFENHLESSRDPNIRSASAIIICAIGTRSDPIGGYRNGKDTHQFLFS